MHAPCNVHKYYTFEVKKFVTVNNSMSLDTRMNNISHLKSFMNVEVKYHKGNNTNFMSFGFSHVDGFLLLLLLT
jgi:hypothetical protein